MNVGAIADLNPDGLLGMAGDRSIAARAALALSLSELYFRTTPERGARERDLMAEVLQDLIRDVDTCMREVLTRSAAPRRIPASDMARVLGSDDATEVHGILCESSNLTDDDLVAITRRRGDAYRRAIAERKDLNARVTDAMVAVAGDDVILRLVANSSAELSTDAIDSLVARSADAPALRALLIERPELTAAQVQQLGPAPPDKPEDTATLQALPKWLRRDIAE